MTDAEKREHARRMIDHLSSAAVVEIFDKLEKRDPELHRAACKQGALRVIEGGK